MKSDKLEILPTDKIIVIIGLAASGKSTLADKVTDLCPNHNLIRTDDYISHGFKESLYSVIRDIKMIAPEPMIIEGVQGFRLLRKGLENMDFFPDLVINCICDPDERFRRYSERPGNKHKDPTSFDKTLFTIWTDYLDELNKVTDSPVKIKRPRFLNIYTE